MGDQVTITPVRNPVSIQEINQTAIWSFSPVSMAGLFFSYYNILTVGENKMDEQAKIKHSKRILQKENYVKKQVKIAKAHNIPVEEPHKLQDHAAVN